MDNRLQETPTTAAPVGQKPPVPADSKSVRNSLIPFAIILLVCTAAVAWLTIATSRIEMSYLRHYGFFFDPAAYYVHNIGLYKSVEHDGAWSVIVKEALYNERCPGRTIPYLLFAPKLLMTVLGHLWTEIPLLWGFLTLLSVTIYQRTKSLFFSIAAGSIFWGLPFLFDPILGLAAYWLDFTSACAFGAAAVCLLQYARNGGRGWILAFGAFAAAAALCRWSASMYVIMFVAAAVPATFFARSIRNWKQTLLDFCFASIAALPGLVFMIRSFGPSTAYYKQFGYAFGAPISESLSWTCHAAQVMFGPVALSALSVLTVLNLIQLFRSKEERASRFICLWAPISVLLFVCVIAKAVDGYHPLVYFAPALFISAFCPISRLNLNRPWWQAFSIALLALGLVTTATSYESQRKVASNPGPSAKIKKASDAALANLIVATNSRSFTNFDQETCMPHMEVYFFHHKRVEWVTFFSMHESYLKHLYKNQNPTQMVQSACDRVKSKLDLVAVFSDPAEAMSPDVFNNVYSATVSKGVAEFVSHDPAFELVAYVQGPKGKLSVYKNNSMPR